MKTIGLLGGMSWESTATYYRLLNEGVRAARGGLHSAQVLLHSVDFAPLEALQHAGNWDAIGERLAQDARRVQAGGADFLLLCTNTMHKVARVGLLGTRFTMEQDFYKARLQKAFGLEVLVPDPAGRDEVHRIIYQELCLGQVHVASRDVYRRVMDDLTAQGAQGIILGCTEIGLLVDANDSPVPLFDTTALHAQAAVDWMLG